MIKVFNGAVYDVDTNLPISGAKIYPEDGSITGVVTDSDGTFSLMADDGNLGAWYHIDATAKGYGDYVAQLSALSGDSFIYNNSAGGVSKIKAFVKNSFWDVALTVAAIIIILLIAKKYASL
jgi:hypothetical protein